MHGWDAHGDGIVILAAMFGAGGAECATVALLTRNPQIAPITYGK
jgi:hypothetical protein